jgi:DNA-binding Xre family transcriptional regulator
MSQLQFDLRYAMQDFEARTGVRLTYDALARRAGLSVDTIKSMATREDYNSTLKNIAAIGDALRCDPTKYLRWVTSEEP